MNTRKKLIGLLAGRAKAVSAILLAAVVGVVCLTFSPTKAMAGDSGGEPETVDIPITMVWDDNDNERNNRPDSVMYGLYSNGTHVEDKVATKEEGYATTFAGLPKYDEEGTEIAYSIREWTVRFYRSDANDPPVVFDGTPITVVNKPDFAPILVTKVWDDGGQVDKRPNKVELDIYDGDTYITTVMLTPEDATTEKYFPPGQHPDNGDEGLDIWTVMTKDRYNIFRNAEMIQFRVVERGADGYVLDSAESVLKKTPTLYVRNVPAPEPEPVPEPEPMPEPTPEPTLEPEAPQTPAAPTPAPVTEKAVVANPKVPLVQTGDVTSAAIPVLLVVVAVSAIVAGVAKRKSMGS